MAVKVFVDRKPGQLSQTTKTPIAATVFIKMGDISPQSLLANGPDAASLAGRILRIELPTINEFSASFAPPLKSNCHFDASIQGRLKVTVSPFVNREFLEKVELNFFKKTVDKERRCYTFRSQISSLKGQDMKLLQKFFTKRMRREGNPERIERLVQRYRKRLTNLYQQQLRVYERETCLILQTMKSGSTSSRK